ncbi:MAG: hypothetical protein R6X19_02895 [Kiritimatiellia bacterium]
MKRKLPKKTAILGLFAAALCAFGQLAPIPLPAQAAPGTPGIAEATSPVPQQANPEGLTSAGRDPFWPVGFVPKSAANLDREKRHDDPASNAPPPKWAEAKATLRIGGYMKTPSGYTALVNNALVKVGDLLTLTFDGKQYRWTVESISVSGLTLTPMDWTQIDKMPLNPKDRP